MKPLYLKLVNFMNHEKSEIDFTKLSNASVVVGIEDNNDSSSNGAGKTNLFNAFKYVLFDSKISDSKEKIIKYGAKSCSVEFVFKTRDGTFKIERKKAKSTQDVKFFRLVDEQWENISERTITQTNRSILSALKLNENTFENVAYLKQNDYARRKAEALPAATPAERKSIIIDMLQLNQWSKYEKAAKQLRDEATSKFNTNEALIKSLGDPEKEIEDCVELVVQLNESIKNLNSQLDSLSEQLNNKKQELAKIEDTKVDQSELNRSIKDLSNQKNLLVAELGKLNKLLGEKDTTRLSKELTTKQNELKQTQDRLNSIVACDKPSYDLVSVINKNLANNKTNIYEQESLIKKYSQKMPDDDFCPTCGTELTCIRDSLIKEKEEKIQQAKLSKDNLLKKAKQLNDSKLELELKIKQYEEYIQTNQRLQNDTVKLSNSIESYNDLIEQNKQLLESLNQNIRSKQEEINNADIKIKELVEQINNNNVEEYNNKLQKCKSELNICLSSYNSCKTNLESKLSKKGEFKKFMEIKANDIEKLNEYSSIRKELDTDKNLYKSACSCFSSSGIPAMIIHTVLDELQLETNKMLSTLKSKIQLKFIINKEKEDGTKSDTLDIVYYKNNIEQDFVDLSGGQQGCVVLSIKLAMANVSRRRCGADIKLLLLDEIDQPLDKTGTDNLYSIIKEISNDVTILVITHNKSFEEKFSSKIKIENINDSAFIKSAKKTLPLGGDELAHLKC